MIKGESGELAIIADENVCSIHKTPLTVVHHPTDATWVLLCAENHYPDTVSRILSSSEVDRAGTEQPGIPQSQVWRDARTKRKLSPASVVPAPGVGLPALDVESGQALSGSQLSLMVAKADEWGLDAYRGHLCFMYGKLYPTLDAHLFKASCTNQAYDLLSRPLTSEERQIYIVPEGSHAWIAELMIQEPKRRFGGVGIITREDMEERSKKDKDKLRHPVYADKPWQLAQVRAEWQVMRRGFPIGGTNEPV